MKLNVGDRIPMVVLPAIDGKDFNTVSLDGNPYMLSFYRFASCPFCNLRISELVSNHHKLAEGFKLVAIFDTPLKKLAEKMEQHQAPFKILSDEDNFYYKKFDVQRSVLGMIKPMIFQFPTVLKAWKRGYSGSPEGNLFTMPADFLIDENGFVEKALYSKDQGEHIPINDVIEFSFGKNKNTSSF